MLARKHKPQLEEEYKEKQEKYGYSQLSMTSRVFRHVREKGCDSEHRQRRRKASFMPSESHFPGLTSSGTFCSQAADGLSDWDFNFFLTFP